MSANPKYSNKNKLEQNILLKISQSIIGTLDYEEVLQIISDGMSELLEIESAAIYLLEQENKLFLGATTPPLDANMPVGLRIAKLQDHPHIQKTIESKEPQYIRDTQTEALSQAEQVVVELRQLRSLIYFAFVQKNNVLGVLILGTSNKSRSFSKNEINLGQTVANQLSIGIQNARLHHELLEKNKNLVQNEAHLSNALLIAKLGHWEYDVHRDEFTFTDEFYSLYHTSADKEGGYKMSVKDYSKKFLHPEDSHIVREEINRAILNSDLKDCGDVEYKIIYTDTGKTGYITVRYKIIKNEKGEAIKFVGVNQDLTRQKQIEEELKKHRDHLQELVKEKTRELDNVIEKLKTINEELSDKNSIIDQQNQELIAIIENLKNTQSKLIQAEKMASLGILTAGVAHEINNPLNYIMGAYEALNSIFEHSDTIEKNSIETIMNSLKEGLERSITIVKELNQFSRNNSSHKEKCKLTAIIANCLNMINNQLKGKITVKKEFSDTDSEISGNIGELHQAFLNILINAYQAIADKGKITIKIYRDNNNLIIEIADTGSGIKEEDITKITDPFFTTKDPGKGTGLGLSIAYSIIKDHKGILEINSEIDKGTTVKVSFPL
ncbi:MAG: GAF domain-containing protein [Bacteroidales bacterium]|nr:GAF domain-containing protein [Bacteroidales bacterium]MBN2817689.1 GAF domain-containing protein [Bacteroidales bacterium]